jgi:ribonuclease VapC
MIDASALVAMMLDEPDADRLNEIIMRSNVRLTSAIALWETTSRLHREAAAADVDRELTRFLDLWQVQTISIGAVEARIASDARRRYGSGKNGLNMGDCFAYACANANNVPLLYIGNDFPKTDVNDGYTL